MLSFLAAAAETAEKLTALDYGWLLFGALVIAFVAIRVFSPGGALVEVDGYGRAETIAAGVLCAFFLLLGFGQFAHEGPPSELTLGSLLANAALLGSILFVVLASISTAGRSLRVLFGFDRSPLFVIFCIGLLLALAAFPLVAAGAFLTQKMARDPNELQAIVKLFQNPAKVADRWAVIASAVILAPICEEVFFRGLIYGVAKRFGGVIAAIIFNAALFAFIHGSLPAMGGLFVLAVCLTLAYEFTGSLLAPIAMHAAFNAGMLVQIAWTVPGGK